MAARFGGIPTVGPPCHGGCLVAAARGAQSGGLIGEVGDSSTRRGTPPAQLPAAWRKIGTNIIATEMPAVITAYSIVD
jgi:hypothetical protein